MRRNNEARVVFGTPNQRRVCSRLGVGEVAA